MRVKCAAGGGFAECSGSDTRQVSDPGHSANNLYAECLTLGKSLVCRVFLFYRVFFEKYYTKSCLRSARENALGKHKNIRQA